MEFPKFIIYDNEIIYGTVEYHKQLLPKNPDVSKISGGGQFKTDKNNKIITFYGSSYQYGGCKPENIQSAIKNSITRKGFIYHFDADYDIYKYDSDGNLINNL